MSKVSKKSDTKLTLSQIASEFGKMGNRALRAKFKTEEEYSAHMKKAANARWKKLSTGK